MLKNELIGGSTLRSYIEAGWRTSELTWRYGLARRQIAAPIERACIWRTLHRFFGRYPSEKYTGAAYHNIAAALNSGVSFDSAIEFVRRLALTAITGNGDMHLKNWSLLYPGDGRTPTLAPIYDVLSTVPYIPKDGLALSLTGEKSFKALTPERWRNFANRSRLPEGAVVTAVAETAAAVRDKWSVLPERDVVPGQVLERIDAHIDEMVPILDP